MSDRLRIEVVGAGSISSISLPGIFPHLTQEDIQMKVKVTAVCNLYSFQVF